MPEHEVISKARVEELGEIRRFLVQGFAGDQTAVCFDESVLRWKYFLPIGDNGESRSLIVRHEGKIVGHIGMCPREFCVPGKGRVSTVHFIDWLASREHPLVGMMLMLHGSELARTQYGVGGSAAGRAMLEKMGYEKVGEVGDYVRVLSPGYRLHGSGRGVRKYAAAVRDAGKVLMTRVGKPGVEVELQRVETFGEEVERVVGSVEYKCVFTGRSRELLNYYLAFPGGKITGWTICSRGEVRGFALLGIFEEDGAQWGRIIECFLSSAEAEIWQAAVWALTAELKLRRAEAVSCYASAAWLRGGLEMNGFSLQKEMGLTLRDKEGVVPRDLPFHVTQLEGDYAYL